MSEKVRYTELLRSVAGAFSGSSAIKKIACLDTIQEGVNDLPLLQVYPVSSEASGGTDRIGFGGGGNPMRQEQPVFILDYYVRQRSHIGDDMLRLIEGLDVICEVFRAQNVKPYFGNSAIKAFHWLWERAEFSYSDVKYVGIRYTLTLTIF